ncbi:LOW QUALITY PROTEIN: hypothetical protein OSB04_un000322 [Centaurea solstitialis]|uniref:Uncharacterized protein n=1 Tax=Centaurea solstitialis TaxID=347529 RepID=A0AA38SHX3_9ASTR|nr:LOW QUALITY PROTEIN: hypothetical protein OSB04_un000322 [Centaurea solstitialis]
MLPVWVDRAREDELPTLEARDYCTNWWVDRARGRVRVFQMTTDQAAENPEVVAGTFLVNFVPAMVLFDTGVSITLLSLHASHMHYISRLGRGFEVDVAGDHQVWVREVMDGCTIDLYVRCKIGLYPRSQVVEMTEPIDYHTLWKNCMTYSHRVFELNQENLKLSSDKSLLEMKIVDLEKLIQSEKGQESKNSKLSNQITKLQQSLSVLNAEKAELILKVTNLENDKNLFENNLISSHSRVMELSNQVNDFEKIVIIERSNFEKERRAFETKINELSLKTSVFDKPKDNEIFKEFSESNCYVNCCYDDDDSNSYDGMNVFDSLDSCTNKNNVVDSELLDFEKMLQEERKVFEEERKVFEEERKDFEKKKSVFECKKKDLKKKSLHVERDRCVEFVFEEETKDFEKERKFFEEKSVLFRKKIANLEVQLSDERSVFKRKEHLLKCEIKGFEQMIAELKNKTFEKSDFEEEKRIFEMEIRKLTRNLSELSSDIMKEQIMSSNLKKKLDETVEEKNILSAMVKNLEDIVFKVNLNEPKSPDVIVQSPYVDYADSVCSFKTAPSSLHADVSSTKSFTPTNQIRPSNLFYDHQIDGSGKNHSKKGNVVWRVKGTTPNVDKPKLFVPKQNVQKNNVFKAKSFVKSDPIYSVNHMIRLSQKKICCSYYGTNKFVRKDKSESWYELESGTTLYGHLFPVSLYSIGLEEFDMVLGIDWLTKVGAAILCREKLVKILLDNGSDLVVYGDRKERNSCVISLARAKRKLRKRMFRLSSTRPRY